MAETNIEHVQPASPEPMILTVDDDLEAQHPGHDSAFSRTPIADPESSAELFVDHDTGGFADEEDEDMHGGFNDNDSTYGGSLIGCDSDTLASYITDYRYENGRRYHAYRDGEYWVTVSLHLCIVRG
jgi:hypothetical protein